MSEQNGNDRLQESRKVPIFLKSDIDDLNLTIEAFRVYGHLARRAGTNNTAFPSYASIGEQCFRGSYPNSSAASLKAKAIAAINELIAFGLIYKETRKREDGTNHVNIYHLTESGWNKPETPLENCNVRKGNPGKERKKRLTGITGGVNGDNPPIDTETVNGDNRGGLTGITGGVNGDNPKVLPLKVLHSEGSPIKKERSEQPFSPTELEQPEQQPPEPNAKDTPPPDNTQTPPLVSSSKAVCGDQKGAAAKNEVTPTTSYDSRYSSAARFEDRFKTRTSTPGHPYPDLVAAGYGQVWVGQKRNDFDPWVVKAQIEHLKKYNLPHEEGDAKNSIGGYINKHDWRAIELRWDRGLELKRKAAETQQRLAAQAIAPTPSESPAEPPAERVVSEETKQRLASFGKDFRAKFAPKK
jgi:hypothetical protein